MDFIAIILRIIVIAIVFNVMEERTPYTKKEVAKAIIAIQIMAIFISAAANSILYTQHGEIIDYTINTLCTLAAAGIYLLWDIIQE